MLQELFTIEGYQVDRAADGQRALHLGLTREYDVIVLDRGLPALDGLDVLNRLRSRGVGTPTLVLSALANPADRVDGLDAGAEDYLGKPFDVDELLARVRALLRRHHDFAEVLPVVGGELDLATRSVHRPDRSVVTLSPREGDLLGLLARHPGRVFTRRELLDTVFEDAAESVVDTYVHYLRKKVGRGAVETVRGLGYRLGRSSH
ncbi:MAG: response regulator transcription factor [Actinomycetota bacterium]|nr:response regulator transcription factor [Actinomycetota bacterium]